jgi:hypothetical protein
MSSGARKEHSMAARRSSSPRDGFIVCRFGYGGHTPLPSTLFSSISLAFAFGIFRKQQDVCVESVMRSKADAPCKPKHRTQGHS